VDPNNDIRFLAVARIARARGNRGEVLADLYTDYPDRFASLREVWLEFAEQRRERVVLEGFWFHSGRLVLKIEGVESISAAERLSGAWVLIEPEQAVPLPEGCYFDHELAGCRVLDLAGAEIGRVSGIRKFSGNNLIAVEGGRGEILIPAVASFIKRVSIDERTILVDLPEGLIDLNE
jgi:16S rRNA processing protein RimM